MNLLNIHQKMNVFTCETAGNVCGKHVFFIQTPFFDILEKTILKGEEIAVMHNNSYFCKNTA